MFVRTIDIRTKPGMSRALCASVAKGVPVLNHYPGFIGCMCLLSEEVPDLTLVMTLWDSKESAEHFQKDGFPVAAELYRMYAEGEITLLTFEVGFSTAADALASAAPTA